MPSASARRAAPLGIHATVLLLVVVLLTAAPAAAQQGTTDGEWRTWAGDLGATRYAPLDQIDASNFDELELVWRYRTANLGPRADYYLQTTPLMVDGVLYATAGSRRNVVAIDAATGEHLWLYRLDEGERAAQSVRRLSGRGVGYWTDGAGDERIYFVTIGYQLVALDAKTGWPVPGFGVDGIVDLKQNNDQDLDPITSELAWNGAPVVAGDTVLVGAARPLRQNPAQPPQRQGLRARLRRPDRRAALDLPHHPAAGGVRERHVGGRLLGIHRQHRRLDPDDRRHRAGHRLPAGRDSHQRLLRRAPAGRQPVRREPRRGRCRDRGADLALPVRPSSRLGLRRPVRADPGRHHRRRPRDKGDRAADQAGLGLRLRPRHRRAGLAHRGAPRAGRRHSRRVVLAHPALPHQAAAVRAAGVRAGGDHRSDPGARGRGATHRPAVPLRPPSSRRRSRAGPATSSGRCSSPTAPTGPAAPTTRRPASSTSSPTP